ncbi:hypothetical protein [Methanothermococcus sp.]|uniref:hypothetical protein n=1 Tax=Methanothermococcus sp. TaxID=2614238 RepID=UPI002587264A|nr:hypothetical protein [Methanothermococcus sp.]
MAKLLQLAEFISRIFPFLIVFACIFMYGIMDLIALVLIPLVIWLLWAKSTIKNGTSQIETRE